VASSAVPTIALPGMQNPFHFRSIYDDRSSQSGSP
jgi:hypothetical protein